MPRIAPICSRLNIKMIKYPYGSYERLLICRYLVDDARCERGDEKTNIRKGSKYKPEVKEIKRISIVHLERS